MKSVTKRFVLYVFMLTAVGCSTTGTFVIPEGADLYLYERPQPVNVDAEGKVTTKPYFWTAMGIPPGGGIPYRLEKDGETLKQGRLRAVFRPASVFWPPFAAIYWPVGLNPNITYVLVNDAQE